MQFVLRQEGDTNNPTLARVYGPDQSTRGRVALFDQIGGRTRFILDLCAGGRYGCDGINEYHYNGTLLNEIEGGDRQWRFHPGTRSTGYDDPEQGRPEFFPSVDFCFSGKCYLEVNLPESLSPSATELPDGSEVFMRGLRVMQYDLVDGFLEETTPACTANNAWVGMDTLREVGKLPLSRFQRWAQSWINYEARCDFLINWDRDGEGGIVTLPRHRANVVFPGSFGFAAAFQTVIDRSPGVMWQDVNGGIQILPNPDRGPVHTFNSYNVLKKGITLTPPEPDNLYNYFLFLFRDVEDVDSGSGQLLYRPGKAEVDLATLRDAHGGILNQLTVDLGGGPMTQSEAERIAWYTARNLTMINAERDQTEDPIYPLRFEVKGQMDSFHLAKADYAEIADHYMVGLQTPLCKVTKETTHARRGERTFSMQLTSRDSYRDTDHSAYQAH